MKTFKYYRSNTTSARLRRSRSYARGVVGQYMSGLGPEGREAANAYLRRTQNARDAVDALYAFYRLATGKSIKKTTRSKK